MFIIFPIIFILSECSYTNEISLEIKTMSFDHEILCSVEHRGFTSGVTREDIIYTEKMYDEECKNMCEKRKGITVKFFNYIPGTSNAYSYGINCLVNKNY